MHIDVWADVTCPWCYLGIHHLRAALAAFDHSSEVEVALHAFFLDPELDQSLDVPRRVHLIEAAGLSVEEALAQDLRLVDLGRAEGIAFDLDRAIVAPTANAHKAIAAAAEYDLATGETTGPETASLRFYEALGRAALEMGLDVSDPDVVIGCAQDVALSADLVVEALTAERFAAQVFSDFQIGVQMGIDVVPTCLFDRRFVVQDHQSPTAMKNILATAFENSEKENR